MRRAGIAAAARFVGRPLAGPVRVKSVPHNLLRVHKTTRPPPLLSTLNLPAILKSSLSTSSSRQAQICDMPVPTHVEEEKNIWIAAADGDLERVKELIESNNVSPNEPDPYTYTPMHAAASYGQLNLLEYLIEHGGDVNITDSDGDTPLYTVESEDAASFLVKNGAKIDHRNNEGVSPAEHLEEDFPELAAYLRSLSINDSPPEDTKTVTTSSIEVTSNETTTETPDFEEKVRVQVDAIVSQHSQHNATEHMTTSLLQSAREVMERATADGRDGEEELRALVERTVMQGMITGYDIGAAKTDDSNERPDREDTKRQRKDD